MDGHRANVKQLQVLDSSKFKSTIKARKAELAVTRMMREQFEKNERIALRSSKVYQHVHKRKREQMKLAQSMSSKGAGEYYVDSDRRIAVGAGAEDLKGQVEKYKDEMTTTGKLNEQDLLTIHILMEQGKHDLRSNKPAQALTYVEKALRLDASLVDVLELKCQCFLGMNRYQEALEAADLILYEMREDHNAKALAVKADALYNMGNFEHALVNLHMALRHSTTREKEKLNESIKRTELAVLNAVGPQVSHYFKNLDKILVHITKTNILGMPWHKVKNVVASKDKGMAGKVKDRKFLNQLATDKHYLEGLTKTLKKENTVSEFSETEEILNETNIALDFLNGRREFWSQQNPEYPDEIKVKLKSATPMDKLMIRLIAKQKCQTPGMMVPSSSGPRSALEMEMSKDYKPFLNYQCKPTMHMKFEVDTGPAAPQTNATKKAAKAIVLQTVGKVARAKKKK